MVRLRAASLALVLAGASPGVAHAADAASPAPEMDELLAAEAAGEVVKVKRWRTPEA